MKRFLQLVLGIAAGIALSQPVRRRAMFALTVFALLMLFVGSALLWNVFAGHPLFFAIYWLACAWVTICVILLAIYDLLMIARHHRQERRRAIEDLSDVQDPRKN